MDAERRKVWVNRVLWAAIAVVAVQRVVAILMLTLD